MLHGFKLPYFLVNVKVIMTKVVFFLAEVVGREWKKPDRATGVPAPPPRRHRNFWLFLLLVYSYIRDQRQLLFSLQRQLKFPIFHEC